APWPTGTPGIPCSRPPASRPVRSASWVVVFLVVGGVYRGLGVVAGDEGPVGGARAGRHLLRVLGPGVSARQARERALALHDAAVAGDALVAHEIVEAPRLAHVLRHVRRERRRNLAVPREIERELRLLDRGGHPLRLRHELGLAEPPSR